MRAVLADDDMAAFCYGLGGAIALTPWVSLQASHSLSTAVAATGMLAALGVVVITAHADK